MNRMAVAQRVRRSHGIGRAPAWLVVVALTSLAFLVVSIASASPARAEARTEDRVAPLSRMLTSSSEKTRLSAVLALAKLGEPRVDQPLIRALRDPSAKVRGVAAAALGRLDCAAALPMLRAMAHDDGDPDVRKAATAAAMKITGASHAGERERDNDVAARRQPPAADRSERPIHAAAFPVEPHPELYVLVNSSTDEAPGTADPATRRRHGDYIKRILVDRLRGDAQVTSVADEARRWELDARHLDLSVTRLAATRSGPLVEVDAQLRIAISDDSGKMLSFLSGGAKVQVPADKFDAKYLPALRTQALDSAIRGMFDKLFAQLRAP